MLLQSSQRNANSNIGHTCRAYLSFLSWFIILFSFLGCSKLLLILLVTKYTQQMCLTSTLFALLYKLMFFCL